MGCSKWAWARHSEEWGCGNDSCRNGEAHREWMQLSCYTQTFIAHSGERIFLLIFLVSLFQTTFSLLSLYTHLSIDILRAIFVIWYIFDTAALCIKNSAVLVCWSESLLLGCGSVFLSSVCAHLEDRQVTRGEIHLCAG